MSVPCNIAEGSKRRHRPDYARFLNLAESSLAEVEALLMLSKDLGHLSQHTVAALFENTQEIARMLSALGRTVELTEKRETKTGSLNREP